MVKLKNIVIIRLILWLILLIFLAWLAYNKVVPGGKISYTYEPGKFNYFIGKLSPADRVRIKNGSALLTGEPIYFSLKPPRHFEKARVSVKFKNTSSSQVIELGVLNDKVSWNLDLKPLENKIIDQLAMVWPVIYGSDEVKLIQREKKYETIEEFLRNMPPRNEIGLYNYNLKNKFILNGYAPGSQTQSLDYSLRGSYQYYTYIKNEDLDFAFNFIDLNINKDEDPVDVKVYSQDGLIFTQRAPDSNEAGSRAINLKIPNLSEGIYRVSFVANDDIVTKNIATRQNRFSLINKAWLARGNGQDIVLYTDSDKVSVQTINPASLGVIKIGGQELNLQETYKQISSAADGPTLTGDQEGEATRLTKIELPKDDIIISGNGVFSFSETELVNPGYKNISQNINLNNQGINYILSFYKSPAKDGEWSLAEAEFNLEKAYQEQGKFQFIISAPGYGENREGKILIKEIKVELTGNSLWQKLKKFFSSL